MGCITFKRKNWTKPSSDPIAALGFSQLCVVLITGVKIIDFLVE